MILDITSIYHNSPHTHQESLDCQRNVDTPACQNTNAKTFVDDNILTTKPKDGMSMQLAVLQAISRLEQYTNANLLSLNP